MPQGASPGNHKKEFWDTASHLFVGQRAQGRWFSSQEPKSFRFSQELGPASLILRVIYLLALENQDVLLCVGPAAGLRYGHKDGYPDPCPQDLCSGLMNTEGEVETLAKALRIHLGEEVLKHFIKRDREYQYRCCSLSLSS